MKKLTPELAKELDVLVQYLLEKCTPVDANIYGATYPWKSVYIEDYIKDKNLPYEPSQFKTRIELGIIFSGDIKPFRIDETIAKGILRTSTTEVFKATGGFNNLVRTDRCNTIIKRGGYWLLFAVAFAGTWASIRSCTYSKPLPVSNQQVLLQAPRISPSDSLKIPR